MTAPTPDPAVVERVAKASAQHVLDRRDDGRRWHHLLPEVQDRYRDNARAAIAALAPDHVVVPMEVAKRAAALMRDVLEHDAAAETQVFDPDALRADIAALLPGEGE